MSNLLKELSHIYWIGGSPCAGKTSIAQMLAEEQGFRYYKSDDSYDDHVLRSRSGSEQHMYKLKGHSWGQYWASRFCSVPVEQQVAESIAIYQEQFPMIIEDLLALPDSTPVIVEGAVILPSQVAPLLGQPNQAIWLFPTPEFQLLHYAKRPWVSNVLEQTEDPRIAFSNWMDKEIRFARETEEDARLHGFESLKVDGRTSLDQNFRFVKHHFGLS